MVAFFVSLRNLHTRRYLRVLDFTLLTLLLDTPWGKECGCNRCAEFWQSVKHVTVHQIRTARLRPSLSEMMMVQD